MNSRYEIESQYMKIDSRWESKMASIHSLSTYQDSLYYIAPTDFNIYRCQGKDMCVDHTVRFGNFICQRNNFHMMSTKNIHAIRIILQP